MREKRITKRTVLSLAQVNDWKLRWLAKEFGGGVTSYIASMTLNNFDAQATPEAWEELFETFPHMREIHENWGNE